ncbi:MAG TPA: ABC transporter permease [Thermoanaerobaculia bacterium]|nr:ABC transporter permease [Thermoanaerobaculia bacterium]
MHTVIKRRTGLAQLNLREVWEYRDLLRFLAWRDISIRYKQTYIGVGWAFIRPFLTMVIFTFVFGKLARLPSEGVPYPVLTFTALLPWQFFATAFAETANSVVGNGYMVTKIYFPRLLLPLSSIAVAFIDFLVSFLFLIAIMAAYRMVPPARVVALPLFALLCIAFTVGLGLWFAALYVKYRDVRHFIPFITQLGLFASPVAFSSSIVPEQWRPLYSLNPMVSVIDGFRWSLLGTAELYVPGVIAGAAISVLLLVTGIFYFKQTERVFADVM